MNPLHILCFSVLMSPFVFYFSTVEVSSWVTDSSEIVSLVLKIIVVNYYMLQRITNYSEAFEFDSWMKQFLVKFYLLFYRRFTNFMLKKCLIFSVNKNSFPNKKKNNVLYKIAHSHPQSLFGLFILYFIFFPLPMSFSPFFVFIYCFSYI